MHRVLSLATYLDQFCLSVVSAALHGAQRLTAFGRGAAPLLCPDDLTAGCLERRLLDRQVLISRAHPGVPDDGHGPAPLSRLILDRFFTPS
jgi:hypothetical protein